MPKTFAFSLAIVLSVITVLGDYFIKEASLENFQRGKLLLGCLIYALTGLGWAFAMKGMNLSSLGVVYGVTCVVLLAVVGTFVFHEKTNPMELAGIALGISSIILLYKFA